MKKLIGIDIGGTKCAVVQGEYTNDKLHIKAKETFETRKYDNPASVLGKIAVTIYKMTGDSISSYEGIGISCGGPLDSRNGCILSPPNLPGWDKVKVVDYFKGRFKVPAYLQNDANAGALAEWRFGAGKGLQNLIFLTCGTGMGAGLILNGELYTGMNDMAGEAGHIRLAEYGPVGFGKSGSFEGFCSGGGIARLAELRLTEYRQTGRRHPLMEGTITAKRVFEMAYGGDKLCEEICGIVGEHLGRGMAVLIDILNPQAVIGGSVFARNYELLMPYVENVIKRECIPAATENCRILPALLAESIGDMAALTVAMGLEASEN